jgi:acyl-CoA reductase-like NAD-dependent aldehyde dehydrogenase
VAAPTQVDIDHLAQAPVPAGKLLINGNWLEGEAGESVVLSPLNGLPLTTLAAASAADVGRAVASARAACGAGWPPAGARQCCSGWPI